MNDKTARIRLNGGPRDGWVYDVKLHWELTHMGRDVEWVPPSEVVLEGWPEPGRSPGSYFANGREQDGVLLYDWSPSALRGAADKLGEAMG